MSHCKVCKKDGMEMKGEMCITCVLNAEWYEQIAPSDPPAAKVVSLDTRRKLPESPESIAIGKEIELWTSIVEGNAYAIASRLVHNAAPLKITRMMGAMSSDGNEYIGLHFDDECEDSPCSI